MADHEFIPGTSVSQDLNIKVELSISGKNLLKKSFFFIPQPNICVVYIQNTNDHSWTEYARTERLEDNYNPEFLTRIQIVYCYEEVQNIKFKIYHMKTTESSILNDKDCYGEAEITLGQLMSSGNVLLKLHHPSRKGGEICIKAEEIGSTSDEVEFEFIAEVLNKKSVFSFIPDPYLAIYKEDFLLCRTTIIKDSCNPTWPKFTVPLRWLRPKNGQDVVLKLQCWDWNYGGFHKLMGEILTTSREILCAPATFSLNDKESGKKTIIFYLNHAEVKTAVTFMDYVRFGTQIHWTIAIDFHVCSSPLHVIGTTPSAYEQVLQSIIPLIQEYDCDKQFPVLGFGAKVPPCFVESDEFFVNMNPNNPYCSGVAGVIEAYRNCLPLIQRSSSYCNFVPVINHVNRFAANHLNGGHYFVLLILTHSRYFDESKTKKAIIAASHSPMSIVVVGIGDKDFSISLQKLDDDEALLSSGGQIASRNIVKFVVYKHLLHQSDPYRAVADLSRSLLTEIPDQVVAYMRSKNISAKRPD